MKDIRLHIYTDSDFAGCGQSYKSTSGVFLTMEGPHTYFPIGYLSKMMSHVAYSTPEGELAGLTYGLQRAGSPGMVMWEKLSGQTVGTAPQGANKLPHVLVAHGDNSASISIARTGKNPR